MYTKIIIFDTETTGLLKQNEDISKQPNIASISWLSLKFCQKTKQFVDESDVETLYIKTDMPDDVGKINGLTTEYLQTNGVDLCEALNIIYDNFNDADLFVCHNTKFDIQMLLNECIRCNNTKLSHKLYNTLNFCTAAHSRTWYFNQNIGKNGHNKRFRLTELYKKLFDDDFSHAHTSSADTIATKECFIELVNKRVIDDKYLMQKYKAYCYISFAETADSTWIVDFTKTFGGATFFYKISGIKNKDMLVELLNTELIDCNIIIVQDDNIRNMLLSIIKNSKYTTTFGFKLIYALSNKFTQYSEFISHKPIIASSEYMSELHYINQSRAYNADFKLIEDSGNIY